MDRANVTIATIDIGSNSVRLLILDNTGSQLVRETNVTALGRGVDATHRFRDDTVAATLDVMREYAVAIDACGATRVHAVATSASRDAENGEELMASIASIVGTEPEIISGTDEAELSFEGATSHIDGEPPYLVIDIGGGSTEFVYGNTKPSYSTSIDIGSVRLSDRYLPDRPPTSRQLQDAAAHVDAELSTVELPGVPRTVIGAAGTFTSLAAIDLGLARYDRDAVHGAAVTRSSIRGWISTFSLLTVEETAAIPALDPKRAPVILAGAVLADRAAAVAETDTLVVSEYGLLNALATRLLADG